MIISKLTGKAYRPEDCIFLTNPIQCAKYCKFLGTEFFMDVIVTSEKREDALVFVWKRCPETREAKIKWDNHLL